MCIKVEEEVKEKKNDEQTTLHSILKEMLSTESHSTYTHIVTHHIHLTTIFYIFSYNIYALEQDALYLTIIIVSFRVECACDKRIS